MVPCQWNREVFQKCGVTTPIAVIPHTLDDEHPRSGSQRDQFSHSRIKVSDFVFYSINAWTPRKALWDTLEAYLEAFFEKQLKGYSHQTKPVVFQKN